MSPSRSTLLCAALVGAFVLPPTIAHAAPTKETRTASAKARVTVVSRNDDFEIRVWDKNEVQVEGDLAEGWRLETKGGGKRVVFVVGDQGAKGAIVVRLPKKGSVDVTTIQGDIDVQGVEGHVHATAVDGDVAVQANASEVEAQVVSGDVTVKGKTPRASLRTVSGEVKVQGIRGRLDVTTVSGEIEVRDAVLERSAIKGASSDVLIHGVLDKGPHSVTVHSGDVELHLPKTQKATLTVSTFSGDVDNKLGGTSAGRGRQKKIELGGGGTDVAVRTFSGDVILRPASQKTKPKPK